MNNVQFIEVYDPKHGAHVYALGDEIFGSSIGKFKNITIPCERHTWQILDEKGDKILTVCGSEIIPFYDTKYLALKRKVVKR
ncbi:hypothetical protein [Thermotalea metallivorans]|uniref:Uncharacterized protein n=1 Tax=Thermotalea metallivorans TaxID=520762 RepID=A0A140LCI6_9FIRM|nr:hypothetical protein [Thermotalea metallivorans]KXG78261.1 hypothetical protein AN619_02360 [Thermotalea metallivorans]